MAKALEDKARLLAVHHLVRMIYSGIKHGNDNQTRQVEFALAGPDAVLRWVSEANEFIRAGWKKSMLVARRLGTRTSKRRER